MIHPWRYTKASATTQANGIEAAVARHPLPDSGFAPRTQLHDTDHLAEFAPFPSARDPSRRVATLEPGGKQARATARASPRGPRTFSELGMRDGNITMASLPQQLVSQPVQPYRNSGCTKDQTPVSVSS